MCKPVGFVFIDKTTDADTSEVPVRECAFDTTWPADQTQVYEGQLLDRRQEVPLAVDVHVYTNGNKEEIAPGTHFIIQNTDSCPNGYVGLEGETVRRQALAGKPPGPTVTDAEGPGFGILGAVAGLTAIRLFAADKEG